MSEENNTGSAGTPEPMAMPEAAPAKPAAKLSARPDLASATGGMEDYPGGRGGMGSQTMPDPQAAHRSGTAAPAPRYPIGAMPHVMDMASLRATADE